MGRIIDGLCRALHADPAALQQLLAVDLACAGASKAGEATAVTSGGAAVDATFDGLTLLVHASSSRPDATTAAIFHLAAAHLARGICLDLAALPDADRPGAVARAQRAAMAGFPVRLQSEHGALDAQDIAELGSMARPADPAVAERVPLLAARLGAERFVAPTILLLAPAPDRRAEAARCREAALRLVVPLDAWTGHERMAAAVGLLALRDGRARLAAVEEARRIAAAALDGAGIAGAYEAAAALARSGAPASTVAAAIAVRLLRGRIADAGRVHDESAVLGDLGVRVALGAGEPESEWLDLDADDSDAVCECVVADGVPDEDDLEVEN